MKTQYCLLEKFNNYFNRKLALYTSLEDYVSHSASSFIPTNSDGKYSLFDFNPHDNITTEITVNDAPADYDYFLLLDEDHNILSRWYVMEQKRNRLGQWVYYLRRDVLADKYDSILTAPLFVEKGVVTDPTSPLLLNNEDVKVNQIKKQEILLKDKSECPWLVMYLKKGVLGNDTLGPNHNGIIDIDSIVDDSYVYEELNTPIASWANYQYVGNDYIVDVDPNFNIYFNVEDSPSPYNSVYRMPVYGSTVSWMGTAREVTGTNLITDNENIQSSLDSYMNIQIGALRILANALFSYNTTDNLSKYNDKIIKDSDGKYYRVRVVHKSYTLQKTKIKQSGGGLAMSLLYAGMNAAWLATGETENGNDYAYTEEHYQDAMRLEIEEISSVHISIDFGDYSGIGTKDSALFDALCMPYGAIKIKDTGNTIDIDTASERSMNIMNALATALTSQYVLDLQLLPYCPVQGLLGSKIVTLRNISGSSLEGKDSNADTTDVLIVAGNSSFTFDIGTKITPPSSGLPVERAFEVKYVNDCTMIRLCSPNYNGVFEMNLAKNGGEVDGFNVDVTLRPFNPYIHVNPYFDFVYGEDFNDVRGLVCGGDFSLGILDDQWNVYEIQNKNYQSIFDRQIQNMDVNNAIARQEALFGAVAGVGAGVAGGAVAGMMSGAGPLGGLVGGAFSAVGGVMDYQNLLRRQEENRNYAIDNYNLTLGNVKALPYSITRTSAITFNNKLFPFVEIYDCTDIEKEAYMNKLAKNGMNIGIIDEMVKYISTTRYKYFRARMIKNFQIAEDYHFLATINEELMKGVYI